MKRIMAIAIPVIFIVLIVFIVINVNKGTLPSAKRLGAVSASSLCAQAKDFEAKGKLLEAKNTYQKLISEFPNASQIMSWQKKTEELNMALLCSPVVTPNSASYEIKPGDTLSKIANDFNTTTELLMKSNNLTSDRIVPGRKIKVWTAPFSIIVYKSQNILVLRTDEEVIKTYVVATGKNNSTPVGTFTITTKLPNPAWFRAGAVVAPDSPENILGSRWLGFNLSGYGIHGTTEPQSLGQQVTQGCVRMSNSDVEELYRIIPIDTEVTIVD